MHRTKSYFLALGGSLLLAGLNAGCGTDSGGIVIDNGLFASVVQVSTPGEFFDPRSAVPDASNQSIYFTASGEHGRGVFEVPATRLSHNELFVGAPFVQPIDIAMSTDNQTLFVADRLAVETGRIFALSVSGGRPVEVAGTAGTKPVALDVIRQDGNDRIYFCGTDSSDGQPAVYEISAAGATSATLLHKGAPLIAPGGITAASDGTLFIADRGANRTNAGTEGFVFRMQAGTPKQRATGGLTTIASGFTAGNPPGIVLTPDERSVIVSSLNSSAGTAQVLVINRDGGGAHRVFNNVIGAHFSAGGLHGARNAGGLTGAYAWCDLDDDGSIYRLR